MLTIHMMHTCISMYQGIGSKSTGSKHTNCDPVKCGWICTTCKIAHRTKEAVLSHTCVENGGVHTMVQSPVMCNKCFCLSDDMAVLRSKCCPKALSFESPPEKTSVETGAPAIPTSKKVEKNEVSRNERNQVEAEMEATRKEIRRLQLLREMQLERQRLADLIAQKRAKVCFLSMNGFSGYTMQQILITALGHFESAVLG